MVEEKIEEGGLPSSSQQQGTETHLISLEEEFTQLDISGGEGRQISLTEGAVWVRKEVTKEGVGEEAAIGGSQVEEGCWSIEEESNWKERESFGWLSGWI